MNQLTIIGNLTRDPETRDVNTNDGMATVCNLSVAVNRYVHGEKRTDYFRVSCWGKLAQNAAKYLTKGAKVAVVGPVTARAFTGQDGSAKVNLDLFAEKIEFLSSSAGAAPARDDGRQDNDGFEEVADDEVPF